MCTLQMILQIWNAKLQLIPEEPNIKVYMQFVGEIA